MRVLESMERLFEALVRVTTEHLLGRPTDANMIEIRDAVLEEVESAVEPVGRGEKLFAFDRLVLRVASPDARRRALLEVALRDPRVLGEIRTRIRRAGAEPPRGMTIEVAGTEAAGEDWTDPRYSLEMLVASQGHVQPDARAVQLRVTRGRTLQPRYVIERARVNIGRRADVLDEDEHLVRRNDVAFDDDGEETNMTVSRVHAHVSYDSDTRSWRVADDGSAYGTRVFREGRSIEVPRGPRGVRLRPGDEIYCGQACLRFEPSE